MDITTNDWNAPRHDRTARAIAPGRLIAAAFNLGLASISSRRLARTAGVSETSAWRWLAGTQVSRRADLALRRALGLEPDEAA